MKIEIVEILGSDTIRITTQDERWYKKPNSDPPIWIPSVTWISEYYPKGIGFYKWLANKGWDEAQSLKEAAGDKGSRVHHIVSSLIAGNEVKMDDTYTDANGIPGEISVEEWEAVMSFVAWQKETKAEFLLQDKTVFNDKFNYAGTLDFICDIETKKKKETWLIDLKTSQFVWPSHKLQISAYKHSDGIEGMEKIGILQVGYRANQKGFKLTEIEDYFELFLAAKLIWAQENKDKQPKQKDYPISLKL